MTLTSYADIDELAELVGNSTYDCAGEVPLVCHHCRRDLRACLDQGRGPITMQRFQINAQRDGLRPVCEHCKAGRAEARPLQKRRERERDTMARINWREPMREDEPPLWAVANQVHERVGTWNQVAILINDEYGLNVMGATCATVVKNAHKAGASRGLMPMPEFAATAKAPHPPAPSPFGMRGGNGGNGEGEGDTAAGLKTRPPYGNDHGNGNGEGDDEDPFADGGEDEGPRLSAAFASYTVAVDVPGTVIEVSTTRPHVFRHVGPMLEEALAGI